MSTTTLDTTTVRRWTRYPEYRAANLDWQRDVPKHWEVKRLKWTVTACQNGVWGDEPTGSDDDIACIRVADFDRTRFLVDESRELTVRSVAESQRRGKVLRSGDLLIEKSGGGDLQPVGAVVLYNLDRAAVSSNFVARMPVAEGYSPEFLRYLHAAMYTARVNTRSIKQSIGIQNLDSAAYLDEPTGLPPLQEQRAIAAFLDRETARIDALIGHKERLIALLEEKRQAVISHAVTRGLDTAAPLKDSGIPWLGMVPRHWRVQRLKFAADLLNGYAFPSESYVSDGIPVIRIGDVRRDIEWDDVRRVPTECYDELPNFRIYRGDVLLAMTGATIGKTAVFSDDRPALLNQRVGILRAKSTTQPWLGYVVASDLFSNFIDLLCYGGAQENIGKADIGDLPICVPPRQEQSAITAFLDKVTAENVSLVSRVRQGITRLEEYRTALISAAVAGQIDVRGEVTP